jgi:hypothetical protein
MRFLWLLPRLDPSTCCRGNCLGATGCGRGYCNDTGASWLGNRLGIGNCGTTRRRGNRRWYRAYLGGSDNLTTLTLYQRIGNTSANSTTNDNCSSTNQEVSSGDFPFFYIIFILSHIFLLYEILDFYCLSLSFYGHHLLFMLY